MSCRCIRTDGRGCFVEDEQFATTDESSGCKDMQVSQVA